MLEILKPVSDVALMTSGVDAGMATFNRLEFRTPDAVTLAAAVLTTPVGFIARSTANSAARAAVADEVYSSNNHSVHPYTFESYVLGAIDLGTGVLIDLLRLSLETIIASKIGVFPGFENFLAIHAAGNFVMASYHRMRGRVRVGLTQEQYEYL